jgi:hypothetical protein
VGLKLIDRQGNVLHEWLGDREYIFQQNEMLYERGDPRLTDVHGSTLLPGGDVVFNFEYVGMVRLNSCGEVQWSLAEGNHHSISQAEDGSFWVPGVSRGKRTRSEQFPDGYPGLGGVSRDRILYVSAQGEVTKDILVLDVLYQNGLERYIAKMASTSDVTHLNDVEPLSSADAEEYPLFKAGDLAMSLRATNLVFVFDPDAKTVKWHATGPRRRGDSRRRNGLGVDTRAVWRCTGAGRAEGEPSRSDGGRGGVLALFYG